eukprot:scaffold114905_cov32-Tisochrysis_lutea.AAC.2
MLRWVLSFDRPTLLQGELSVREEALSREDSLNTDAATSYQWQDASLMSLLPVSHTPPACDGHHVSALQLR